MSLLSFSLDGLDYFVASRWSSALLVSRFRACAYEAVFLRVSVVHGHEDSVQLCFSGSDSLREFADYQVPVGSVDHRKVGAFRRFRGVGVINSLAGTFLRLASFR